MIDPKLITFLTICKTRNYTRAAEILNLTQPAVTKHIKSLEDYYCISLFKIKGRSIDLTEEGEILFEYANDMEAKSSVLERKLKNSFAVEKRYLIGATLTIGEYILPYILGKYKESHPNHDVIMQVYNTEIITQKLINGEIDLALVEGPFDKSKFNYTKLMDDELVLAASPQSYLSQKSKVGLDEVIRNKLILREEGSGTRKVLENKLIELGVNLNSFKAYMEIGSLGAIKSLVELNLGYTIISKAAIQKEVASHSLLVIPIKDVKIQRNFDFIYIKESPKEFLDCFVEFSKKYIANSSFNHTYF